MAPRRFAIALALVLALPMASAAGLRSVSRAETPVARAGRQVSPVLTLPPGVTVELRGMMARMSNGDTFTCGCSDVQCSGSCTADQRGSQLTCSGTCMTYEEFYGCVRDATCGWSPGSIRQRSIAMVPMGGWRRIKEITRDFVEP